MDLYELSQKCIRVIILATGQVKTSMCCPVPYFGCLDTDKVKKWIVINVWIVMKLMDCNKVWSATLLVKYINID